MNELLTLIDDFQSRLEPIWMSADLDDLAVDIDKRYRKAIEATIEQLKTTLTTAKRQILEARGQMMLELD